MIKILAVDDERFGLQALTDAISEADPQAQVTGVRRPLEAEEYARENPVDVAFLDIQMAEMSGIELAKKLKLINPKISVVFATGFDSFMGEAFSLHASGYILKPITPEKVQRELDNLRMLWENAGGDFGEASATGNPDASDGGRGGPQSSGRSAAPSKGIRLQCFGNFEAFYNGVPLRFKYDKTKEMLAYLCSRSGALSTNGEIITNLWEDDGDHESYLRRIRKDLLDTLKECGSADIVFQQRGKMGLDVTKVSCDYYDFLKGDISGLNSYRGEFMTQYSWGEMTNAELDMQRNGGY